MIQYNLLECNTVQYNIIQYLSKSASCAGPAERLGPPMPGPRGGLYYIISYYSRLQYSIAYMSVYILCIYIYIYVLLFINLFIYIFIYIYMHLFIHIYIYIYTCIYNVYIYIYIIALVSLSCYSISYYISVFSTSIACHIVNIVTKLDQVSICSYYIV